MALTDFALKPRVRDIRQAMVAVRVGALLVVGCSSGVFFEGLLVVGPQVVSLLPGRSRMDDSELSWSAWMPWFIVSGLGVFLALWVAGRTRAIATILFREDGHD